VNADNNDIIFGSILQLSSGSASRKYTLEPSYLNTQIKIETIASGSEFLVLYADIENHGAIQAVNIYIYLHINIYSNTYV
jgi:hypothetical protein